MYCLLTMGVDARVWVMERAKSSHQRGDALIYFKLFWISPCIPNSYDFNVLFVNKVVD
jgi:hypothetical protein